MGSLDNEAGFYVEDDGVGISQTSPDTVFEKGYSSKADGTGFGLTIVKRIVEMHDWDIELTESTDGGVRFEIVTTNYPLRRD